jgi:hypothetical protein
MASAGGNENARGLRPELWGPPVWQAFHYTAAGFPPAPSQADRDNYRQYFGRFPHVLPCEECKHHAVALLARLPPVVDSRDRLFAWSVQFHNAVNTRIGAPELPLAQARTHYGLPELPAAAVEAQARAVVPPPQPSGVQAVASGGATHARPMISQPAVVRPPPQSQRVMGFNPGGLSRSSTQTMYRTAQQHHIRAAAPQYQPRAPPQVSLRAPPPPAVARELPPTNTRATQAKRRCNCGK